MQFQKYEPFSKLGKFLVGIWKKKKIPGDFTNKLAPLWNGWLAMQSNHDQKQKHLGDES